MDNNKYIYRILKYIDRIIDYVKDVDYKSFNNDSKLIDACLMNFTEIGESVNCIDNAFINMHNDIDWKQIKGMRNIIVHDYDGVNMKIVWDTIQNDLPLLKCKLQKLL